MKKLVVVLAMMLGMSGVAQAGVLIEPYLGYEYGKYDDGKITGTVLGARLAYTLPAFVWLGIDATMGISETSDPDSGPSRDVNRESLGLVVGVDLPILLRVWAGYGFHNKFKADSGSDIEGKNMKIGVGFTALPFVSINLEYIKDTFDEPSPVDLDVDTYMLSVSLPLEF